MTFWRFKYKNARNSWDRTTIFQKQRIRRKITQLLQAKYPLHFSSQLLENDYHWSIHLFTVYLFSVLASLTVPAVICERFSNCVPTLCVRVLFLVVLLWLQATLITNLYRCYHGHLLRVIDAMTSTLFHAILRYLLIYQTSNTKQ